ncbi:MAG: EamA family transporter [Alphaproteobacteria bacterium]|nr:EamA family transporter [Alphaproteobacteria bacterium]
MLNDTGRDAGISGEAQSPRDEVARQGAVSGATGAIARLGRRAPRALRDPNRFDWLLLGLVVMIGGSSFAMIRTAVETLPPAAIMAGRLWVAAGLLYVMMKAKGRRFPAALVRTPRGLRLHRAWASMAAVGIVGNTIPFFLFPWAQQHVESGLAGVYMAFMPIWTLGLAYVFAAERLTRNKALGFAMGLAGVLILMGPEAMKGVASSSLLAQGAMLLATIGYAASAVLARRAPPVRPRTYTAGVVLTAAIAATPALLFTTIPEGALTPSAIAAVIGLGVGPSGIGSLFIIIIIRRVGATFMALANYVTPLWSVTLGALLFAERLSPSAFAALAIILTGVFVSQRKASPVHKGRTGALPDPAD